MLNKNELSRAQLRISIYYAVYYSRGPDYFAHRVPRYAQPLALSPPRVCDYSSPHYLNFSKMEGDLNFFKILRRPQYFQKRKMTSILWKMEDDLNL